MTDKVVSLKGGTPTLTPEQELARLTELLPGLINYGLIRAKLQRSAYLALVKEGFTEAQALELCKAVQ